MVDPDGLAPFGQPQVAALFGPAPVRRIDTHAATIFLAGDRAWKVKRPVRLDYLDFSTPDRRRAALEAELALNQQLAPSLYRTVHAITRAADGALGLDGEGAAVDWVLEMNRFPDGALLSELATSGRLDPKMLTLLVDRIVDFHDAQPAIHDQPGAARLLEVIAGNTRSMAQFPGILPRDQVAWLQRTLDDRVQALAPLLGARERDGRVRHGHGDFHLRNIALVNGEPTPFDRLEFSAALATGDVLYDLAFLVMDLWHSGLGPEANLVFNRYLDRSPPDEDGAPLMPLFMAVRSSIRAHTTAMLAQQQHGDAAGCREARGYLELACSCLKEVPARLIAIGGASGTGKSSVARAIADRIGHVPGARILRSDLLRKRAAGVLPETRLAASDYGRQRSGAVYADLRQAVRTALQSGQSVIADATFLEPHEQVAMASVAAELGLRFDGLWLVANEAIRVARVDGREADASDADATVARAQTPAAMAAPGWHQIAAEGPLDEVAAAASLALGGQQQGVEA